MGFVEDFERISPVGLPWKLEDIPFARIELGRVKDDMQLFAMLTCASFVEIASDLYARNLVAHFADNDDVVAWISGHWQPEEVQHGRALKAYVKAVWPDFPWAEAFDAFLQDYAPTATQALLEPRRALEMAARCMVETGTATFYMALGIHCEEPVLRQLVLNIRNDEIRHYKHFYRFFKDYNALEGHGNVAIARTLVKRMSITRNEDAYLAYKHFHAARYPREPFTAGHFQQYLARGRQLARRTYPFSMAAKMTLHLLNLNTRVRAALTPAAAFFARGALMR
ncbi:MAG: ferritin-like domain-containing protein [Betaproteobacteria bacterium]|nr:ferritin-like domain-containing protein [Betaproteobacteria bacterium]